MKNEGTWIAEKSDEADEESGEGNAHDTEYEDELGFDDENGIGDENDTGMGEQHFQDGQFAQNAPPPPGFPFVGPAHTTIEECFAQANENQRAMLERLDILVAQGTHSMAQSTLMNSTLTESKDILRQIATLLARPPPAACFPPGVMPGYQQYVSAMAAPAAPAPPAAAPRVSSSSQTPGSARGSVRGTHGVAPKASSKLARGDSSRGYSTRRFAITAPMDSAASRIKAGKQVTRSAAG